MFTQTGINLNMCRCAVDLFLHIALRDQTTFLINPIDTFSLTGGAFVSPERKNTTQVLNVSVFVIR